MGGVTCEHTDSLTHQTFGGWSVWRSPVSRVPRGVHVLCWGAGSWRLGCTRKSRGAGERPVNANLTKRGSTTYSTPTTFWHHVTFLTCAPYRITEASMRQHTCTPPAHVHASLREIVLIQRPPPAQTRYCLSSKEWHVFMSYCPCVFVSSCPTVPVTWCPPVSMCAEVFWPYKDLVLLHLKVATGEGSRTSERATHNKQSSGPPTAPTSRPDRFPTRAELRLSEPRLGSGPPPSALVIAPAIPSTLQIMWIRSRTASVSLLPWRPPPKVSLCWVPIVSPQPFCKTRTFKL